ncbi:rRNA pseudouridine synthase [Brumimicrobium glaciale]|jgi:23S rRNA pseudouridine2605 synthase|uniref:rRNA pseudouridine synthase n=1 Tax=Brumimicrobium glaciale TaxID=200475 RepID=A0A4V1WG14_9FLAO|nr:S4 domain-containing protein [Brumimicrobium glaciale]RYM35106.1 rRNA pseudouridine synthase [Brumimicrobium glaciale]
MSKISGENPKSRDTRGKGKSKYDGKPSKYLSKDKGKAKVLEGAAGLPKKNRNNQGEPMPKFDDKIRLNKYLSNAGICSRRGADTLIESGTVSVNGTVITELGYKVNPSDVVRYDGAAIKRDVRRYVLVNKPKDFGVRYSDDPAKKSVYNLIQKASREMLDPVGKMDRLACGLILYTNDADMEKKLMHPKFKVSQLFHVVLKTIMSEEDLEKLTKGLFVDDMMFSAEEASFINGKGHNEIGVKIFSNKSNKVKLMMGKMGYEIVKLDRVEFAGLDKKDLPRGQFRHLTEKEVSFLKMS